MLYLSFIVSVGMSVANFKQMPEVLISLYNHSCHLIKVPWIKEILVQWSKTVVKKTFIAPSGGVIYLGES